MKQFSFLLLLSLWVFTMVASADSVQSIGSMKIASGMTPVGSTNWISVGQGDIYVDVDTSAAGFSSVPNYVTSLAGNSNHWITTGASSVYLLTEDGFRIYIHYLNGAITPEYC